MHFVDIITDPSLHYITVCLSIGLFYAESQADRIAYVTNPFLLGVVALALLTVSVSHVVAKKKNISLSFTERKLAQWYLMNGAFVHILMDGLSVFYALPGLHSLYYLLDARYKGDATVDLLSLFELFVMGPLCLIQYYAVRTKASFRHPLQIAICSIQFMGTVIYLGSEAWVGWKDIAVDYDLTFSTHYIVFFWFTIVFGCSLWLFVPLILLVISFKSLSVMAAASDSNLIPINAKTFKISSSVFSKGNAAGTPFSPLKAKMDAPIVIASPLAAAEPTLALSPLPLPTVDVVDSPIRPMPIAAALLAEAESIDAAAAAEEINDAVADEPVVVEAVVEETVVETVEEVVVSKSAEVAAVQEEPVPVMVAEEADADAEVDVRRPAPRRRSTRRSVAPQY